MRFSIVVPVYNSEKYLEKCLKSILNQSYKDFEVVLIDDGSTDKSGEICDKCGMIDSRVKVVHQKNQGQLAARLNGIKESGGEYIVFCDSDDLLDKKALSVLSSKIEEYNPDGILYCSKKLSAHGLIKKSWRVPFNDYQIHDSAELFRFFFSTTDYIAMWSKCFKRTLYTTTGLEEYFRYRIAEDFIQSVFLLEKAQSVLIIPDELYYYRSNPNGILNKERRAENYNVDYSISKFVIDFMKNHPFFIRKDFEDQKYFTVLSIIERLEEISNLSTCFERKVQLFEQLKRDPFFQENIAGFDTSVLGKKRKLYEMFLDSEYEKLINTEKRITLPKRVRHCVVGVL